MRAVPRRAAATLALLLLPTRQRTLGGAPTFTASAFARWDGAQSMRFEPRARIEACRGRAHSRLEQARLAILEWDGAKDFCIVIGRACSPAS